MIFGLMVFGDILEDVDDVLVCVGVGIGFDVGLEKMWFVIVVVGLEFDMYGFV